MTDRFPPKMQFVFRCNPVYDHIAFIRKIVLANATPEPWEFALLAGDSKFKGFSSYGSILDRARKAKGEDAEGYRAEFIRLVETAELIEADSEKR